MRIVDLIEKYNEDYFLCLEEWSNPFRDAMHLKRKWYEKMKEKGLRVKLALDKKGVVGGMIHYLPIEHSFVDGERLYFIPCIWVHGHQKGRGNFQNRGMGTALLKASEEDAKSLGAQGIAAWGLAFPGWMEAQWFIKHGYEEADRVSASVLVWKRFDETATPPKWFRQKKEPPLVPGKVTVTAFINGWCPAMNMLYERTKKAASQFGDAVVFRTVDTFERSTVKEWGLCDTIFIDNQPLEEGKLPSYEEIYNKIASKVRELPSS